MSDGQPKAQSPYPIAQSQIRVYTKQELGLEYRPELTPESASKCLMAMLWENAALQGREEQLRAVGLTRESKKNILTKAQVALIFDILMPP